MTTYNGEKYILKQLESIAKQSLPADEVIICDDGSTDNTVILIKKYINENKLKKWSVYKNDKRLGYVNNFIKAIELTKGDYIFLADQDDIFYANKFRVMINYFENNKKCKLLNANFNIIDKNDNICNELRTHARAKRPNGIIKIDFKRWLYESSFPGFSMGFRSEIREKLKDINVENCYGHDQLIGLIALSEDANYEINDVLSGYRMHDNNTTGGNNVLHDYSIEKRIRLKEKELNEYRQLQIIINNNGFVNMDYDFLEARKAELEARISYLRRGDIMAAIKLLFISKSYHKPTILGDLLFLFKDKIK